MIRRARQVARLAARRRLGRPATRPAALHVRQEMLRAAPERPADPTPELLRCPRCGATVAVLPPATAWCLPCGQRMRPIRPKGNP